MRTTSALIVLAVLGTTLVGCSAVNQPCEPENHAGAASSVVEATGRLGAEPKTDFPTPLVTDGAQVSTIHTGTGRVVRYGDVAALDVTVYLGATGETLTATEYSKTGSFLQKAGAKGQILSHAVACRTVGSRLAYTTTIGSFFGAGAGAQAGVSDKATIVAIVDVMRAYAGKATGRNVPGMNGMPAVTLTPAGRPGISVPNEKAPTDLRISTLKQGSGREVKKGDTVLVNYTAVDWDAKTVDGTSWDDDVPVAVVAESVKDHADGVAPGWAKALIGSRVGSQVVVVIPPKENSSDAQVPQNVSADSTMVIVFDVLGIQ